MSKPKFPQVKTVGSATVTIYRTPVKSNGKKYDAYTVRYYLDGKPQQKKFGKYDDAGAYADEILGRINKGTIGMLAFTPYDLQQLIEMKEILGGRASPVEAAKYYVSKHSEDFTIKIVEEVKDEMIAAKVKLGISEDGARDLRTRLGKFCKTFGKVNIGEVTGKQIYDWLDRLTCGGRSRNNYRGAISTLMSFALTRKYLPRDYHELENVPVAKVKGEEFEVFTPEEMRKMLEGATGKQLLYLILGGFAGLRTKEIARLHWNQVGDEYIEIKKGVAKTAKRRLVPILPNLKSWLDPLRQKEGKVIPMPKAETELQSQRDFAHLSDAISTRTGIEWRKNALRHSFISYRVAETKSVSQTALDAGTSERKVHQNYREVVTEAKAKEWFGIYKTGTKTNEPK